MSKIVIIGSHGMLGTALLERFGGLNEVIGLDRPEIDITDEHQTKETLLNLKPDVIINAAAINAVDDIESKPEVFEAAWKVNAKAVETLGMIGKTLDIPVVHYSSDYVFDGTNKEGYTEDSHPKPVSKYGEIKFESERLLKNVAEKFYIIRLSRLFGPAGAGEGVKKSFVDKMLELAALGKQIKVVDSEWSCPTYSKDLADFTFSLLENELPFGIYHGANSGACTWYEWARETFRLKNIPIEIEKITETELKRPAQRPLYSELLTTKTSPLRLWEDALKEYLSL